ncbi:MAG: hypothetical protein R3D69_05955 [Xanthobacteraceae bacterium]
MSGLGTIEADVVEDLLLEFVSRMSASGALLGISTRPSGCFSCIFRRSGSAASWMKSAGPPAAACGSSPTCRKRCSPTI